MGKYQAYPEYKDSGVEWLGKIPVQWQCIKLKYVASLEGRKTQDDLTAYKYVGLENIESWSGTYIQGEVIQPEGVSTTFNQEDVLFGKLRPYLAKSWLAAFSGICSSEFLVLRSKKVSPRFLNYYFLTEEVIKQVDSSTYGSKMPRASWDFIGLMDVSVPVYADSEKIASFLDHETTKIDTLIYKQQQLIQLLKEKRQAVISHAVTKGLNPNAPMRESGVEWLGEVPIEWRLMNLGWFSDIRRGSGYQNINMNVDQAAEIVSMFRISDIHTVDPVKIVKTNEVMRYTIAENDILVAGTGATAGISTIIKKEDHGLVHSYNSIKVRIENKKISNQFVQYYLCSNFILGLLDVSFSGSAQHFVDINGLSKLKILIPSINEQLNIVSYLNKKVSDFESLEKKAIGFITLLQERRTALISAAVTGKIDVRHHASHPTGNDTSEVSA